MHLHISENSRRTRAFRRFYRISLLPVFLLMNFLFLYFNGSFNNGKPSQREKQQWDAFRKSDCINSAESTSIKLFNSITTPFERTRIISKLEFQFSHFGSNIFIYHLPIRHLRSDCFRSFPNRVHPSQSIRSNRCHDLRSNCHSHHNRHQCHHHSIRDRGRPTHSPAPCIRVHGCGRDRDAWCVCILYACDDGVWCERAHGSIRADDFRRLRHTMTRLRRAAAIRLTGNFEREKTKWLLMSRTNGWFRLNRMMRCVWMVRGRMPFIHQWVSGFAKNAFAINNNNRMHYYLSTKDTNNRSNSR